MTSIPLQCFECNQLVTIVKSGILHCDCAVTICPACARKQLAKKCVAPYVQVVTCPKCGEMDCDLDPVITMERLRAAVLEEQKVLMKALDSFSIARHRSCNKDGLILCCKQLKLFPLLSDSVLGEQSDDELRISIMRAKVNLGNNRKNDSQWQVIDPMIDRCFELFIISHADTFA